MKNLVLSRAGLTLDRAFVLANCYAKPGDVVLVSGTLVEGIGNAFSDIDVYVVTDEYRKTSDIDLQRHHRVLSVDRDILKEGSPERDVLLIHTVVPDTTVKVDVEFRRMRDVTELFSRVTDIYEYATGNLILLTKRLTDREEIFIHRLFNCVTLQGEPRLRELLAQVSRRRYAYVAYRWVASDFAIVLDLAGAWGAGEIDRAVEFARENVANQMSGYLRLRGVTNVRRKWVLTYLERTPGAEDLRLRYLDLMYLRGADDLAGKMRYVNQALDFVDELFERSVPLLAAIPDVPSGDRGLELLALDRASHPADDPYVSWEYEYRAKAYGRQGARTASRLPPFGADAPPVTLAG